MEGWSLYRSHLVQTAVPPGPSDLRKASEKQCQEMGQHCQGPCQTPIRAHPIPAAGRSKALDRQLSPGHGGGACIRAPQVRCVRGRGQQTLLAVSERVVLREGVSGQAVEEAQASV